MENLKDVKQFTTVQQVMVAYSEELEQFLTFASVGFYWCILMKSMLCSFFWISDTVCSLGLIKIVFQKSNGSCSALGLCWCATWVNNTSLKLNLKTLKISLWFPVVYLYLGSRTKQWQTWNQQYIWLCAGWLFQTFCDSSCECAKKEWETAHVQYHFLYVQITWCTATARTVTTIFWSLGFMSQLLKWTSVGFTCI